MNNSIYRISLDIHDTSSQISLSAKKGDTARSIYITLTENGKPYKIAEGCYAVFRMKKPTDANGNRNIIYNDCVIEGSTIIYNIVSSNTEIVGAADCEITLYGTNKKEITSPQFAMIIEDKVIADGEVETVGQNEFSALVNATAEAKDLIADVEEKLANDYFKGEPGPQGPEGKPGETPSLDGVIQFWQPNTYYKEEDVCYWDRVPTINGSRSVFLHCKTNHTSHEYGDPLLDLGNWNVLEITANRSIHDAWGKVIHESYATKDELAEAIGQALEGDY